VGSTGLLSNTYNLLIYNLYFVETGKSSITQRYLNGDWQMRYEPTIGISFAPKMLTSCIKLVLWDTVQQSSFRILKFFFSKSGNPVFADIRESYYRGSKIIIGVYDITKLKYS